MSPFDTYSTYSHVAKTMARIACAHIEIDGSVGRLRPQTSTEEAGTTGTAAATARTASGCAHEAMHVGETHRPDGPSILMGNHAGGASDGALCTGDGPRDP